MAKEEHLVRAVNHSAMQRKHHKRVTQKCGGEEMERTEHQWLTPVILVTQEAEIRRLTV
jgi:uncharacterized protein YegJ (DUF2314 family)